MTAAPRIEFCWPPIAGGFRQDDLDLFPFGVSRDKGTSVDYSEDLDLES